MIIYRPLKTNFITQGFGGFRTQIGLLKWYQSFGLIAHNGLDFMATDGEPIYWNCDSQGTVKYISTDISLGYGVVINTRENGETRQHRFWHLKEWNVKTGQVLNLGDVIGWADNTGQSKGTHLHYDLKILNPDESIKDYNNGYWGSVDPMTYYNNTFVLDVIGIKKQQISLLQKVVELLKKMIENGKQKPSIMDIVTQQAIAHGIDPKSYLFKEGVAVLKAESGLNPEATGYNKKNGVVISIDRGIAQINSVAWPDVTEKQARDPEFSANFFWERFPNNKRYWYAWVNNYHLKFF